MGEARKVGEPWPCKMCGASFTVTGSRQSFCSQDCRAADQRARGAKYRARDRAAAVAAGWQPAPRKPNAGPRSDARMTATGKICARCGIDKPVAEFNRAKHPSGYRSRCRECQQLDYKDYTERGGARVRQLRRASKYRQRFNLELVEVEALFASAGYACEACGTKREDTHNGVLVLDHDHACCPEERTCGKCIRGVLCTKCNAALGILNDDPKKVVGLASYIRSKA